jgi:hypothetical protein
MIDLTDSSCLAIPAGPATNPIPRGRAAVAIQSETGRVRWRRRASKHCEQREGDGATKRMEKGRDRLRSVGNRPQQSFHVDGDPDSVTGPIRAPPSRRQAAGGATPRSASDCHAARRRIVPHPVPFSHDPPLLSCYHFDDTWAGCHARTWSGGEAMARGDYRTHGEGRLWTRPAHNVARTAGGGDRRRG